MQAESLGNCPNCAAPISGKVCPYCGTHFVIDDDVLDQVASGDTEDLEADFEWTEIKDWSGRTYWWLRNVTSIANVGLLTVNEAREALRPLFLLS